LGFNIISPNTVNEESNAQKDVNETGNLVNKGFAKQKDGWIYYCNGIEVGPLCKIRPGGNERQIVN